MLNCNYPRESHPHLPLYKATNGAGKTPPDNSMRRPSREENYAKREFLSAFNAPKTKQSSINRSNKAHYVFSSPISLPAQILEIKVNSSWDGDSLKGEDEQDEEETSPHLIDEAELYPPQDGVNNDQKASNSGRVVDAKPPPVSSSTVPAENRSRVVDVDDNSSYSWSCCF